MSVSGARVRRLRGGCVFAAAGACGLLASASAAQEGWSTIAVDERFYALEDETLSGVIATLNGMRLEGPGAPLSQGLTQWSIRPEWRPVAAGGRCRVSDLDLNVRIVVTLPRWVRAERASPTDRERWSRIETSIREHEYRHRDLTLEAAEALFSTLSSLQASGCSALRRAFAGALSLAEARIDAGHAELDRETPSRLIGLE